MYDGTDVKFQHLCEVNRTAVADTVEGHVERQEILRER